jgi:hypothetical protein
MIELAVTLVVLALVAGVDAAPAKKFECYSPESTRYGVTGLCIGECDVYFCVRAAATPSVAGSARFKSTQANAMAGFIPLMRHR